MLSIQLEEKKLDNGVYRDNSISASLRYRNGVLELFMESHLEKWQKLSSEYTIKLFKALNIYEKNDDEVKAAFLSIFTKEAIVEKGSEKIFLDLCEKYDVKPKYGAYFLDSR